MKAKCLNPQKVNTVPQYADCVRYIVSSRETSLNNDFIHFSTSELLENVVGTEAEGWFGRWMGGWMDE